MLLVASDHEVRHPEQSPFVIRFRQPGKGRSSHFGVLKGAVEGVLHRPVPIQDLEYFLVARALEAEIFEHPADRLVFMAGSALQRVDNGQGGLAFPQIAGDWLTQYLLGGGQVQNVVHNLKGDSQVAAVLPHLFFRFF